MTSLDLMKTQVHDAEKKLQNLDIELQTLIFDPASPASINAAIVEVNELIDSHCAGFSENAILKPMVDQLKSQYIEIILERASSAHRKTDS
ncbi:hypothetical protein [Pseudomonas marginalis]|uniref:Uncharacterized protein n=2 Tax=Pseudomonas marginalis TaxID=298 RepID=A0A3M3WZS3_PSEMA|nr:hypothetical protein [Pseudomonas marginalis]OAJ45584.1 hypothetical protein AO064_29610 [Pseudomonas marginalis]RMO63236.1 hypothetical protein ALQ38_02811 [Pseudomonas marginalis pv. marginalis]RMP07432.1 hypothetical protein ALQ29_02987 [Pseudomonas marginalis pv. marginalis]